MMSPGSLGFLRCRTTIKRNEFFSTVATGKESNKQTMSLERRLAVVENPNGTTGSFARRQFRMTAVHAGVAGVVGVHREISFDDLPG
jgi:hypothetical protein